MSNDASNTPDPYRAPDYGQPAAGAANPYGQQQPGGATPYAGGPVVQPPSIKTAVLLMRIGAVLSLLSLLSTFLFRDNVRDAVETSMRDADATVSADTIDAAVAVSLGIAVVLGLFGVALWLWMASANGKGRSWARVVATVLFGISLLSNLVSLMQAQPALQRVSSLVILALGAFIVFLLWKKESSAFYQAVTASRMVR